MIEQVKVNELKEEINNLKGLQAEWVRASQAIFQTATDFETKVNVKMELLDRKINYLEGKQRYDSISWSEFSIH